MHDLTIAAAIAAAACRVKASIHTPPSNDDDDEKQWHYCW